MVWTLTVNPSIDYLMNVKGIIEGTVNRSFCEQVVPGGKGINVSVVLKNLGVKSCALGFSAGFTGLEIQRLLENNGIRTDFVHLEKGFSRINVKLSSNVKFCSGKKTVFENQKNDFFDSNKEETEINGNGPVIEINHIEKLYSKIENIKNGDFFVLAGNIPSSLPETFYLDIMKKLSGKGIRFVVDASSNLLLKSLSCKPFLIKPNNHELSEIFGKKISSKEDCLFYAKKLVSMGAENVLVSLGGEGAVFVSSSLSLISKEKIRELQIDAPEGHVVNCVGAGDSMVAGFIAGFLDGENYENALKMAVCTGSATAFSVGLAEKSKVFELMKKIEKI